MIDLESEPLVSLNSARRWFPKRRKGKRPSLATMYRWSNEGYRGVILETLQVASTRCTTRSAAFRFIKQISGLLAPIESKAVRIPPKTISDVDAALEASGFDKRRPRCERVDD